MPDIVPLSEAASALSSIIIAGTALSDRRRRRLNDFAKEIAQQSRLSGEAILTALEADGMTSEVVERGLEAALRSAAQEKRWLLARVAASALTSDGLAEPDQYPYLINTVAELEPADVQLLVVMATPMAWGTQLAGTSGEGAFTIADLIVRWPSAVELIPRMVAALEREGVINRITPTWSTVETAAHVLTAYGRRFLAFLPGGGFGELDLASAELTFRHEGSTGDSFPVLNVRNLGPSAAKGIEVRAIALPQRIPVLRQQPIAFDLTVGAEEKFECNPAVLGAEGPLDVTLTWRDGSGERSWAHKTER